MDHVLSDVGRAVCVICRACCVVALLRVFWCEAGLGLLGCGSLLFGWESLSLWMELGVFGSLDGIGSL